MSIMNFPKSRPEDREQFVVMGTAYEIDINHLVYFDEIESQGIPLSDLMQEEKYMDNIPWNIVVNKALYALRERLS